MERQVDVLDVVYGEGISKKNGNVYAYLDIQITPTYSKRVFLTPLEKELFNFIVEK